MKKMLFTLFFFATLLLFFGCTNDPIDPNKIWVTKDPIQCLGNEWEQDWLETHDNNYEAYPKQSSETIIKNFYENQGIIIYQLKKINYPEGTAVCLACSCSDGYTLRLLINKNDYNKLTQYNYKEIK